MALLLGYFYAKPKGTDRHISSVQYDTIYMIVFGLFIIGFFFFSLKDYKRRISPVRKELASGSKQIIHFDAGKYFEPFYKKCLLYHPVDDNKYLIIAEEEFISVAEGDEMELCLTSISGLVLTLRTNDKVIKNVEEFSFTQ